MSSKMIKIKSGRFDLAATLESPENPKASIILAHGLSVDRDEMGIFQKLSARLSQLGFEVLRFDFRAHGKSSGEFMDITVDSEIKDLEAAIQYIKSLHSQTDDRGRIHQTNWKIGLLGASFGGGIAVLCTSGSVDVSSLCLWNPVFSYSGFFHPETPWKKKNFSPRKIEMMKKTGRLTLDSGFVLSEKFFESLKKHNPMEALPRTSQPTLILHGDADSIIDIKDSLAGAKKLPHGTLKILENAEHGFHEPEEERLATLLTEKFFLETLGI